jgi:hypothetical protein
MDVYRNYGEEVDWGKPNPDMFLEADDEDWIDDDEEELDDEWDEEDT